MSTKEIVDKHFTENLIHYQVYAKTLTRSRYIWEDLVNETYLEMLKIREPYIRYSIDTPYLWYLGKKVMKSIFYHKGKKKLTNTTIESPLLELSCFCSSNLAGTSNVIVNTELEDLLNEVSVFIEQNKNDDDVKVMVDLQTTTFRKLSETTKRNINDLRKSKSTGLEKLKQNITNGRHAA